jgi:energy-coupling factor transporter ATP-binding protein EcfA2
MLKIWINEIEFNDNSKISFAKNEITVFVGPNNAGKSVSLAEASLLLFSREHKHKIINKITIEKDGDESQLIEFLKSISKEESSEGRKIYKGYSFSVTDIDSKRLWNNYQRGLDNLTRIFVKSLRTEDRLTTVNPPKNIKLTTEVNSHPIHFLQRDDALERRFSDYFRQAFGTDLIVHRNAGAEVPLYVGEKPILKSGEDRVSEGYLRELEKLDLLHKQGDGMRSFVGVLLNAFISYHSILFIDEPEAFLHPPQARLLGKMLAKDLPSERQLFLATHSEDFLKGLLDANVQNLKIIRIQREGAINKVSVLNSSDINNIWNDSLLRHSNVLGGLFHTKVIICESDSDCRFYSAILSAIHDKTETVSPDILFTHCGGKHRISVAVKALKKLDVPIRVVTDFDVLNDTNPLRDIFEELGGVWNDIENEWKLVKTSIDSKRPELEAQALKDEIEAIFQSTKEKNFPKDKIFEIQKSLKRASAWAIAKEVGKSFIPPANATKAFEQIQLKFKEKGLFIVEIGELESFARSIGNHGPKWVNEVLTTKDLKTDGELEAARKFISEVIK